MASKRVEKFAIRKRADAVIRDRRRIERLDDRFGASSRRANDGAEFASPLVDETDTAGPWQR